MNWVVFLRPRAESDIEETRFRYERQRSGLGDEFLDQVSHVMNRLADNPELPPIYYRGFRRSLMRQFPYKFFYRLENRRVIVFRVLHASRDHARWLPKRSG